MTDNAEATKIETTEMSASPVDRLVMSYWYKKAHESPVCGEERIYKYRVYGEKPKDEVNRVEYSYINHYCYA
jgi:hypothetical protein